MPASEWGSCLPAASYMTSLRTGEIRSTLSLPYDLRSPFLFCRLWRMGGYANRAWCVAQLSHSMNTLPCPVSAF
ncbi:unnamed protein product [Protopolystoma xenopodis]|uniref:Uncharacterized protein n=1 Tax=Protopolystoma xenopodis TaxID=117903 RepID=A0A3S5CF43_9PLAT|nr:unnamed protein product [Protopolystoma xenopodis]